MMRGTCRSMSAWQGNLRSDRTSARPLTPSHRSTTVHVTGRVPAPQLQARVQRPSTSITPHQRESTPLTAPFTRPNKRRRISPLAGRISHQYS